MPARLIVNADDFGLTAGVNRAIDELHRSGAITSATLMAAGPAFDDAVEIMRANSGSGVGCHLVFADGVPVCDPKLIPSLVKAGAFRPSFSSFVRAALLGLVVEDDVVREGLAQVARVQEAGIAVTHLDTHKHTHMVPMVARGVLRVATECGIQAIRNPFEPGWSVALGHGGMLRGASVRMLDAAFRRPFDDLMKISPGVRTTDGTLGIAVTGRLDESSLRAMLDALPNFGTWELVVHPGYEDAELKRTGTRLRASREIERRTLTEDMASLAAELDIELIHYGQL